MNQNKLDIFIEAIQAQDFNSAAQQLLNCNQQEIAQALQKMSQIDNFKVTAISVLKRELQPNYSYNDFHTAWLPPLDPKDISSTATGVSANYFHFPVRVLNGINVANDKEIISIGLMNISKSDLIKLQSKTAHQNILKTEAMRHDQISKVAQKIGETIYFECKDDNRLGF